jgi:hypothetical protein
MVYYVVRPFVLIYPKPKLYLLSEYYNSLREFISARYNISGTSY